MIPNRVLDRARKLRAIANDMSVQGTPEGSTAEALLIKLAEKHEGLLEALDTGLLPGGAEVDLGGTKVDERFREHYRAALLAALADIAGCTAMYNTEKWVGKVYGDAQAREAVAAAYVELTKALEKQFNKAWAPRRFGTVRKASYRKLFWRHVVEFLHEEMVDVGMPWNAPSWEGLGDSTEITLPVVRAHNARGSGDHEPEGTVDAAAVRLLARRGVGGLPGLVFGLSRYRK